MNKYIRLFNNHTDYETYLNSEDFVTPSVAHCILENDVHYNPMPDPIFNGYDYVDLDLPSGTLWARANVGALNETEPGLFFAWGETTGYSLEDMEDSECEKSFDKEHYKYCTVSLSDDVTEITYTKYVSTDENSSYFDNSVSLELIDDAASVNMGEPWHIPTISQINELKNNTMKEWMEDYKGSGINGWLFTSNNGNTLFLPAAGMCDNGEICVVNNYLFYWTNLLNYGGEVIFVLCRSNLFKTNYNNNRQYGYSVRGVIGSIPEEIDVPPVIN